MPDSIPLEVAGKEYELRFEQDDVLACEAELKMGYIFFFRVEGGYPLTLSLMICRTLIHHGLRMKDPKGNLIYALPQTTDGAIEAGNLIQQHMQSGGTLLDIWIKCRETFELLWFGKPKDSVKPAPNPKDGETVKN